MHSPHTSSGSAARQAFACALPVSGRLRSPGPGFSPQRDAASATATAFDRHEGYRLAVSEPLLELLRKGDLDGTIEVLRAEPDAARKVRSPITRLRAELLNAPGGARSSSWKVQPPRSQTRWILRTHRAASSNGRRGGLGIAPRRRRAASSDPSRSWRSSWRRGPPLPAQSQELGPHRALPIDVPLGA